ncbi:hypothetical protein [Kineococcus sp. SYSU DK005]|uniref:hypothetical protein n=1 Tax=Kineococcus sp. SYSU DK005 TaxID=3383126 RepID=UPI003D7EDCA6
MTRTRRTALTAAAVPAAGALAVLAAALPAGAAPADPATAGEVAAAVRTSPEAAAAPADAYAVADVRTADADPAWAAARLEPADPAALDPATAVLQRVDGAWRVVSLGTAGVGCEQAPPAVLADLALPC